MKVRRQDINIGSHVLELDCMDLKKIILTKIVIDVCKGLDHQFLIIVNLSYDLNQAAWVAGQYAHIKFSDTNIFRRALQSVVAGMRDPELPVRVDSVFALRSFVEACKGKVHVFLSSFSPLKYFVV